MLGENIAIISPARVQTRDSDVIFMDPIRRTISKAFGVMLLSMTLALGASARLLQPFSGYDAWFFSMTMAFGTPGDHPREEIDKVVAQIQRADYEGDRAALKRLREELTKFAGERGIAAQVQYWRGFALWRRAINGFNEPGDLSEIQADLRQAFDDFKEADRQRPNFVDAKVGAFSSLGMLGASMGRNNPARLKDADVQEMWAKATQLIKEAEAIDPQNPRLIWAKGPVVWHTPAERGGGELKVIEMYEKGLGVIRQRKSATVRDSLEPTWGEPELLAGLAWSQLNRTTPDVAAAEQYAQSALKIVPSWHYLREILLPQIAAAKTKNSSGATAGLSK